MGLAYRASKAEDATIKTQFLNAQAITRTTLLTSAADADTEAARLLALYKVQRHVYKASGVYLTAAVLSAIDLNAVVTLEWDRFGLDAGALFRVIAIEIDYAHNRADITLWG